uniref:Uncharacterized protein n=1 Tax=Arundo donax TaxID=35708 RepID=A0A0A8YNU9_ARUDO
MRNLSTLLLATTALCEKWRWRQRRGGNRVEGWLWQLATHLSGPQMSALPASLYA